MNNRLSYSAISTFNTCGKKFFYHYRQGLRSKYTHAALLFGSAIDTSLNRLLLTKDLHEAKKEFDKSWNFQWVNKVYTSLHKSIDIVYAEADWDKDLLIGTDWDKLGQNPEEHYKQILEAKKDKGWDNLNNQDKEFYNYTNWLSLYRKGLIMLDSYHKQVLPKIKNVLAVQKENYLENSDGDKVVQYLDLIVEWEDGRHILMDNKTSAREYEQDSASRSPQLISYFQSSKDEYSLDAVGFIVLRKGIHKNKEKVCSKCSFEGSGSRHKTCFNEVNGVRCNGVWNETIRPECHIQIIINNVHQNAIDLVMNTFDAANEGIKKENWYSNLSACRQGPIICNYYNLCWHGKEDDLIKIEKK